VRRLATIAGFLLLLGPTLGLSYVVRAPYAAADECSRGSLRGNLTSLENEAQLSIRRHTLECRPTTNKDADVPLGPSYTYEVICDPDSDQGPGTLCSVAPCLQGSRAFALRNLRFPNGQMEPAGYECLDPAQGEVVPGITISQIYSAIRNVKLPGGRIGIAPAARGLANLKSFFWLQGVSQEPVEISIAGSVLHADFHVLEYRWSFGRDRSLVTTGPGTPGLASEVNNTFRRRGMYRVGVTVMWAAEAYLDGRRVGEVDDLVSRAETTYPVAELRTVLTG
jgi:hypothetical protein